MKLKNLVKQRFGSLEVIERAYKGNKRTYWKCKCDCGKEKIILATALVSGKTKTCGCCKDKEVHYTPLVDISKQRFGRLIPLFWNPATKKWLCHCDCGIEKEISAWHLKSGKIQSCGCVHRDIGVKDLSDMTFGKWKVIMRDYTVHNGAHWKCQCECGTIRTVAGRSLRNGSSKSCGCSRK